MKVVKILAIGNSFSVDATEFLCNIVNDIGAVKIKLGNLYINGCSLEKHLALAKSGSPEYSFRTSTDGIWDVKQGVSFKDALVSDTWDIIVLQQSSGDSGFPERYKPYLMPLVDYVNENKTNPKARLAWHMTWAYQADTGRKEFDKFSRNQALMYEQIASSVMTEVIPTGKFSYIIPSGTAIQNMRASYIGDTMTRDGYHMSYILGRYTVGVMWARILLNSDLDILAYVPDSDKIDARALATVKAAVNAAAAENPFK